MFSQQELAPAEDQGVVFGIIQASANSTLDQTRMFTEQVHGVYRAFPEAASIFQLTFPTSGFGGMVTKPWSERTKTAQQLLDRIGGAVVEDSRIRVIPLTPPALPGGGDFPVDVVIASAGEPQRLAELANQLVVKAFGSGMFIFADADVKCDQPQAEWYSTVTSSIAGRGSRTGRGGSRHAARRRYVNRFSIQGAATK